jgi:hypothetical protein
MSIIKADTLHKRCFSRKSPLSHLRCDRGDERVSLVNIKALSDKL